VWAYRRIGVWIDGRGGVLGDAGIVGDATDGIRLRQACGRDWLYVTHETNVLCAAVTVAFSSHKSHWSHESHLS
jgi:hypothetical protein